MPDRDLPSAFDAVKGADARFFVRHPQRRHRIRLMAAIERTVAEQAGQTFAVLAPGERWFVAVRQVEPGFRVRAFFQAAEGTDVDQPEEACRLVYEASAGAAGRQVESAVRRALHDVRGRA